MYFSGDEWPAGKNLAYCPAIWRRMFAEISSDNFGLNYDPSHLLWLHIDYIKPLYEFKAVIFCSSLWLHENEPPLKQIAGEVLFKFFISRYPEGYHLLELAMGHQMRPPPSLQLLTLFLLLP
ncbi:MAG: hypothetical protein PVG74_15770 [Desulfobacterales bacterium]|jgi:sugar phosphate isomerase/epimerase